MQTKNLSYRSSAPDRAPAADQAFRIVALSPAAPTSGLAELFPDNTPVLDTSRLAMLHLTLRLEATVTGGSPLLTLAIAGQTFTLDLAGMDRLAGGYAWQPLASTPALLPVSGGGLATSLTGWQILNPVYVNGSLPTDGAIALTVQASWTDMTLDAVVMEGLMAKM